VMRRAEMGRRTAQELEECQNQLAARARMIQDTEARHTAIIHDEARIMSHRFSEGQQLDRQALAVQLAGVQTACHGSDHGTCCDELAVFLWRTT